MKKLCDGLKGIADRRFSKQIKEYEDGIKQLEVLHEELTGLVYSLTPRISEENIAWYKRTNTLAIFVLVLFVILSILFW